MKNASEIARELAIFYGIEYIETAQPIAHSVVAADGTVKALVPDNLSEIFELGHRLLESRPYSEMEGTSLENMPLKTTFKPVVVFAKPFNWKTVDESSSIANYQFAIAA